MERNNISILLGNKHDYKNTNDFISYIDEPVTPKVLLCDLSDELEVRSLTSNGNYPLDESLELDECKYNFNGFIQPKLMINEDIFNTLCDKGRVFYNPDFRKFEVIFGKYPVINQKTLNNTIECTKKEFKEKFIKTDEKITLPDGKSYSIYLLNNQEYLIIFKDYSNKLTFSAIPLASLEWLVDDDYTELTSMNLLYGNFPVSYEEVTDGYSIYNSALYYEFLEPFLDEIFNLDKDLVQDDIKIRVR